MSLAGTLSTEVDENVTFSLIVTNPTSTRVTRTFHSGQRADVTVFDRESGRQVWRWSDDRAFTQAIEELEWDPGARRTWTLRWNDPLPGAYRAVGRLTAQTPVDTECTFQVR